jgi:hypothetical protein
VPAGGDETGSWFGKKIFLLVAPSIPPYPTTPPMPNVNAGSFYAEYKGHPLELCENIHSTLSVADSRPCIFLAGDSSLDNKHWYFDGFASKKNQLKRSPPPHFVAPALNGFETLLSPPRMVKDVAYVPPLTPKPNCMSLKR